MDRIRIVTGSESPSESRGWTAQLGAALIFAGIVALLAVAIQVPGQELLFGWLVLATGAAESVHAFHQRKSTAFLMHIIQGVAALPVALFVVARVSGAFVVDSERWILLFAPYLIVVGAFRLISAFWLKFPGRFWAALDGAVTLMLGIIAPAIWPRRVYGPWLLGSALGVSFILRGWSLIMFAYEAKRPAKPVDKPARAA
jgi:uncharacterized membrane protein HdeD (DUF308 family)